MTAAELAHLESVVESLWSIEVEWDLETLTAGLFSMVEADYAEAAVYRIATRGEAFPPRPPEIHVLARELHNQALRNERMRRALPPDRSTFAEGLAKFRADHDGLPPSKWLKRQKGLEAQLSDRVISEGKPASVTGEPSVPDDFRVGG